jgi:hypothetical protein
MSMFYFNNRASEWEPFIESWKMHINLDQSDSRSFIVVKSDEGLNVNASEVLIENLFRSYNAW